MNNKKKSLTLIFNQRPIPKQSARFSVADGAIVDSGGIGTISAATFKNLQKNKKEKITSYQTDVIKQYEKNILIEALTQRPRGFKPFIGCIRADVEYMYKHPKSMKSVQRKHIESGGKIRKVTIPDLMDNINKPLFDALRGKFYSDDNIISVGEVSKVWGLKNRITLTITELNIFIYKHENDSGKMHT